MENKNCDCPEPCFDCITNGFCEICNKIIDTKSIQTDDLMLQTLKYELGIK